MSKLIKRRRYSDFEINTMDLAVTVASNSYCERRKVGCLILKGNQIISDGYNGTISGFQNCCEDEESGLTLPTVLHAESNALMKLLRNGSMGLNGCTMFVTTSPCLNCAKMIIQAGIKKLFYSDKHHLDEGLELLKETGIEVVQIYPTANWLAATLPQHKLAKFENVKLAEYE